VLAGDEGGRRSDGQRSAENMAASLQIVPALLFYALRSPSANGKAPRGEGAMELRREAGSPLAPIPTRESVVVEVAQSGFTADGPLFHHHGDRSI